MLLPLLLAAFSSPALPFAFVAGDPVAPKRGLVSRDPRAFDGYTLFSPIRSTKVYLVDLDGNVAHEWETYVATGSHAELQPDGSIVRSMRDDDNPRFSGGGLCGVLQRFDWDGNVTWEYVLSNGEQATHHDFEVLPNGNVLVIVWEYVSKEQAIALGRDPATVGERGFWPDAVLEVKPTPPSGGTVVWEWHAKDHFVQDADPKKPSYGDVTAHPELFDINAVGRNEPPVSAAERKEREEQEREMRALGYTGGKDDEPSSDAKPDEPEPDWMHTNAVHYHAGQDLIALSSPNLNEIWIIDHSTTTAEAKSHAGGKRKRGGDVLWRWGNPSNWGAGPKKAKKLFGQHDVRFLPGEKLALSVFNNGNERPEGKWSSVDELALPFDAKTGFTRAEGADFGPAEPAWRFTAQDPTTFYSFFISGAERLANGNTLVCSGAQGRFFEVTRDGEIVWEYLNPFGGEITHSFGKAGGDRPSPVETTAVFRCMRYASNYPGVARLTAK